MKYHMQEVVFQDSATVDEMEAKRGIFHEADNK